MEKESLIAHIEELYQEYKDNGSQTPENWSKILKLLVTVLTIAK
jgi:hypothetical protein